MFQKTSKAVIYGMQISAAQHMLDFDYLSERSPSVACFIDPSRSTGTNKLFFGKKEILIPNYRSFEEIPANPEIDTLVNFASFRSAWEATLQAMQSGLFKNIIIIAEGIPESQTREIIHLNSTLKLNIVGPATVGAMSAWIFRAGNTGGSLENIVDSKLYQAGWVAFVSKSGGMSNELRRVIADRTNGTNLSIALGWDRYNVMQFRDAMEIFEQDLNTRMIVMLGEVGWVDELEVAEMIASKKITKPVVAWCIGTIGELITKEVQFGHAGAKSNAEKETSSYKNKALRDAWAYVPESFMDFGDLIKKVYTSLNLPERENISDTEIKEKLSHIKNRIPTTFTSTISDERGEELLYNKKPISHYTQNGSFANVIGNLWLKRDLPSYWLELINTALILLADHGPAVSGATNSIITARAGCDVKTSLIAWLTTIGPRFGGAIDGAAHYFFHAVKESTHPVDFVDTMKKSGIPIPGIGHKVKSKFNPDKRCEILLELSKNIPSNSHLAFALEVEKLTLEKRYNLILNVDGMIAACFLDMFESIGLTKEEIQELIEIGIFNAFFILARTTGFIGHILDQKRLKEWLYRTSWDDIMYE